MNRLLAREHLGKSRGEAWLVLSRGWSVCLFIWALSSVGAMAEDYGLAFSTYLGGSGWEHARDVYVDSHGNAYVVGGTASTNFPTTRGTYDHTRAGGGTQAFGPCDAFVSKLAPNGRLIWSTYLGGPGYDRAYGVEVDARGYVYVAGRAGPGFPTTARSFQPAYKGSAGNPTSYGPQNAFVAKLSPDGSNLVWASYIGVGSCCRDIAIDSNGDIYLPLIWGPDCAGLTPPAWFALAFAKALQPRRRGGDECGVVKVSNDGSRVLWATWLGGSGNDGGAACVRVDQSKNVYIIFPTKSTNLLTTGGAYDRTYNGGEDVYAARLSSDGSKLVYGTYVGGSADEWLSTHNLALDGKSNAYISTWTASRNFPTTSGVFDRSMGGNSDVAVVKLSSRGSLLFSTFVGGSGVENPDGIYADKAGNVFLAGETTSGDFPVTSNAFQRIFGGTRDAFAVRLSADFGHLLYSTFMGGTRDDVGRSAYLGHDGSLYLTGSSDGISWPVKNAFQRAFAGKGRGPSAVGGNGDCILAKFLLTRP